MTITKDKIYHFAAGLLIGLLFGLIGFNHFGVFGWMIGIVAGTTAGLAKEVKDMHDYGVFDPIDLVATSLGAIVGTGLAFLIIM